MNIKKYKNLYLVMILILIFSGLFILKSHLETKEGLPKYAQRNPEIQAAYEYALEKPELLKQIPCYCGCSRFGHKNVEDCFVKKFKEDGRVVFEEHGANCGICYLTVLDSRTLLNEGKTLEEVRGFINEKYSRYGAI